jgi:adenylylsulfate reductase subunit A
MLRFRVEAHDADVLIIGGGVAGLTAAIKAREEGASVLVLEKAHTARSGNAGSGIDHIQSYVPEVHSCVDYSVEDMIQDQLDFGLSVGGLRRPDLIDFFIRNMYPRIIELESYGLKFRFSDSSLPGGFRLVPQWHNVPTSFNFEGRDLKPALTRKALEAGALIINRAGVRELLKDGQAVVGAIAIGTRDPVIHVVRSKTTILATSGGTGRLNKNLTGSSFERYNEPSSSVGSGKLLAAGAGAEVVNLEFSHLARGYALDNYSFSVGLPSGSFWPAGRIVDAKGKVIVERNRDLPLDEPDYKKKYRDLVDHYHSQRDQIVKRLQAGELLYFDLQEATDEELERIVWTLGHEGKTGVLVSHWKKRGTDLRKVRFPLKLGALTAPIGAGIWIKDRTAETSVPNLYAAGNELAATGLGGASNAVVFGAEAGIQAARRARSLGPVADHSSAQVERLLRQLERILGRESGHAWLEAEEALQDLLEQRLGKPVSAEGNRQTRQLFENLRASISLKASNLHELGRALEVQDLYDLADLVLVAVDERKTSLGPFLRTDEVDYPAEAFGDSVAVFKVNGEIRSSRVSNLVAPRA